MPRTPAQEELGDLFERFPDLPWPRPHSTKHQRRERRLRPRRLRPQPTSRASDVAMRVLELAQRERRRFNPHSPTARSLGEIIRLATHLLRR